MPEANQPEQLPLLDRFKWIILIVIGLLIIAVAGYLLLSEDDPVEITINPPLPTATQSPTEPPPPTATPAPLEIYVTGAVENPEIRLTLPIGSRVEDAIEAAGGTTEHADLSVVNLASVLRDGDQVHVPTLPLPDPTATSESDDSGDTDEASDETATESPETVESTPLPDRPTPTPNAPRLININTATQADLETLPGIGPAIAERIITYRDDNGQFETIEDLMNVSGIGEGTLNNLRDLITTED